MPLPPYDISGSVRPLVGANPMFTRDVDQRLDAEQGADSPAPPTPAKGCSSVALRDQWRTPARSTTRGTDHHGDAEQPSSSAVTARMKSVCASGR